METTATATKPVTKRFYFNTGVKAYSISNFPFEYHKKVGNVIVNGELQCPYDCNDVPENAYPMHTLCDNPNLYSNASNVIALEVVGGSMASKYAYFRLREL